MYRSSKTLSARTYAESSDDKLENLPQADSVNNKWNRIKKVVQQAASETLKRRTSINKKHWIHENILALIDERKKYKNSQ